MLADSIFPKIFPLTAEKKGYLSCQANSLNLSVALNKHLLVNTSRRVLILSLESEEKIIFVICNIQLNTP